ncbi:MAG: putative PurR-regulated permease PerM [Saprospiraceae bacterium]|jgi:predicted PurR-regulated permease PerM
MNKNEILIATFTTVLFGILFFLFRSILVYVAISAVFAIIGSPLVKLFQKIKHKKFKIGKGVASLLTLASFYTVVTVALLVALPFISKEAQYLSSINPNDILTKTQEPIEKIEGLIFEYTNKHFSIEEYSREKIVSIVNFASFSHWVNAITSLTGNFLMYFFALSFITFFFLKDGRMFFEKAKTIMPDRYRHDASGILPEIKTKLTRYFIGICVEVLAVFLCLSVGLYIVDVKYFIIIAMVAAIFNVVPYIGPLIGIVFGLTIISFTYCSGTPDCIETVFALLGKGFLVFIIVQLLDNILFQPYIYGKSVNAHPLEIFLIVMVFGNLWGIPGLIVAIPAWSVVKIILNEVRKNSKFLNKVYETKSND